MRTSLDIVAQLRSEVASAERRDRVGCVLMRPTLMAIAHDLEAYRALVTRLEEWAAQLDASAATLYDGTPSGVGPFIAAELRRRIGAM